MRMENENTPTYIPYLLKLAESLLPFEDELTYKGGNPKVYFFDGFGETAKGSPMEIKGYLARGFDNSTGKFQVSLEVDFFADYKDPSLSPETDGRTLMIELTRKTIAERMFFDKLSQNIDALNSDKDSPYSLLQGALFYHTLPQPTEDMYRVTCRVMAMKTETISRTQPGWEQYQNAIENIFDSHFVFAEATA
jgi:hypothetical protein